MSRRRMSLFACVLLFLAVFVASLPAQETTGTITGFVRDQSDAVLPGVTVVVRNTATGQVRRVVTGPGGEYTATLLPGGVYEVEVEHAGFRRFLARDIRLSVNDRRRVDAKLQVGAGEEVVEVRDVALAIDTESSAVGTVISGSAVRELPLNGRNIYQLLALQPGVSAAGAIVSGRVGAGLGQLASVNVNGMRAAQNNWLIDGADNNDTGSNLAIINYISLESVAEFRILRGVYSAEFGRSGGGQINVVTRGGTNDFHGTLFYFWRNDALDARNPSRPTCDSLVALGQIPIKGGNCDASLLRYHNFGGNIGGPILRNKLFFFFNEEVRRERSARGAGFRNARVPTQLQRQGNFSEFPAVIIRDPLTGDPFPGNIIPPGRLDPNALALLDLFPLPNSDPALLGGLNNFTTGMPSIRDFREELLRLDYEHSPAHRFFVRYVQDTIPSTEPFGGFEMFGGTSGNTYPGVFSTKTNNPGKNLVADWSWVASPTVINNSVYSYSKGAIFSEIDGIGLRSNFPNFNSPEVFPENIGGTLPALTITGYTTLSIFGPYFNTFGAHRFRNTTSWVSGRHSWKFGYLFSHEFKNEDNGGSSVTAGNFAFPAASTGGYVSAGDAFANFLMGRASTYSESDIDMFSALRYRMHEAFVQDDVKVRPNLTLNLGARWSYILPAYDANDRLTNFIPELFDPAQAMQISATGLRIPGTGDPLNGLVIAGQNSPYGRYVIDKHANTIGPRVGFSWDPWSDGKTAIRGGYGIYFDRTLSGITLQNAFVNPPFVNSTSFAAASAAVTPTFSDPAQGTPSQPETFVPNLITMNPEFKVPTSQHWSLGLQRELWWNLTMDLAYVGNHGTHLLRAYPLNQTRPGEATTLAQARAIAPFRGWGAITQRATIAGSRYDSLQFSLNKRMARGLQFGSAYTWSKVMTDSSSDRSDLPQDNLNLRAERAMADFDKTHIFVFNWLYELPFGRDADRGLYALIGGWQVGGIWRAESGVPLTVFASGAPANTFFGGSIRPDLVGDPSGPQTRTRWFNTSAFAMPAPNTFGNASRGVVRGPGIHLADISIYKNFRTYEGVNLQLRTDFFNAFNHTNPAAVGTTFGAGIATFGQVTSFREPRQIQLGAKLTF